MFLLLVSDKFEFVSFFLSLNFFFQSSNQSYISNKYNLNIYKKLILTKINLILYNYLINICLSYFFIEGKEY